MRETDWGGNWVFFWCAAPGSVNFNPVFCWWVRLCSLPVIYLGPNYGGGNEDNGNLLQKFPWTLCYTQCPSTLQQATTDPPLSFCQRLLDAHGQVCVSLLWGHCSFLLGPAGHMVLFVPSNSLFPQSCVSSGGSLVALMGPPLRGLIPHPDLLHPETLPRSSPLLTHTSTEDTQTQFCLSLGGVSVSWCIQGLFEPSECLWWVWGLILNMISPLLPFCFSFAFGASWKWKAEWKSCLKPQHSEN